MKGAKEYYDALITCGYDCGLIEVESNVYYYDHLLFHVGKHARGSTICVYLIEEDWKEILEKGISRCKQVEVYGPVSGQLGWSETYGFKSKGPWVKVVSDIFSDCCKRYEEVKKKRELDHQNYINKQKEETNRILNKFANYF